MWIRFIAPLIFFLRSVLAGQGITVSIDFYTPLQSQHSCVVGCLNGDYNIPGLPSLLACASPLMNDCYCAVASAAKASSILTSCANSACSSGDLPYDVSSAVSIYDGYCLTAGYTLPGAVAATTGPDIQAVASTTTATPGSTPTPGSTTTTGAGGGNSNSNSNSNTNNININTGNGSSSGGSSSSGLPQSGKIALGVGIGIGIPSLLVSGFGVWHAWKRNKGNKG